MASIRLRPVHPSAKTPEIPLARGESKVIGRSEQADVIVDESSLSRRHAQINVTAEGVVTVEDLGSTNHTFINDVQRKRGSISAGDRVRFGTVEYELEKDVAASDVGDATVMLGISSMVAARRLLVADGSATIRHFVELAFASESFSVTSVGNGDQAIDRIKSDVPDIVLAAVDLAGKTGYEVVQYIRRSPQLAHIPILLLSDAAGVDHGKAEAAGSDGVLGKPLDPQVVIARVKELIARPRPQQAPVAAGQAPAARVPEPPASPPMPTVRTPAHVAARPIEQKVVPAPQPVVEAPKPPAPSKPTLPPALADVFAGLVAATSREPSIPALPDPPPAASGAHAITDDLINDVMHRVLEVVSARVVRETGPDIVSEVAERVVREEIARIKSTTAR
ncbi:MAG: FHA domain-containing protein [Vicinamibacterales bacterium]